NDTWTSMWTRLHKPIKVFKEYKKCDAFDDDKYTKIYMSEYGIDNVKGGSYSQIKLEDDQMKILTKKLRSSQDQCLKCGKKGHFIQKCFASTWDCIKCTYSNLNSLSSCSMCDTINPMASSSICCQKKRKIKSTNSNAKRFQYKKGSYKCRCTCDTDKDDDLVTNSGTCKDDGSTTDNDTDEDGQSDSDTSDNTSSATDNDANDDDDEDNSETDVDSITTSDTDEDDDSY
ncbi:unnamed protein product, partial [Didymodactylos carnosus]